MTPKAIVHKDLPEDAKKALKKEGFSVYSIPPTHCIDERIAGHPDIQIFIFNHKIFANPDISDEFVDMLGPDADIIRCDEQLSPIYPNDCRYNIAYTGKYALYKPGSEPGKIREALTAYDIILVSIPQGYARCSILIVNEDSIITEDAGIHRAAIDAGLTSLLVEPGHVPLKGFPRGFLGGATGRYGKTIYCTGRFPDTGDYLQAREFISSRGCKIVELSDRPMEDFGSILFI
jgi:hypothetical protein